ncbi:ferredoxin reductase-like protein [Setomelanomma holmii]|uniref:Ferredoxin reductase-like protein n=1 Tax=Setomelanomma holmii TaxID=210430 RepID=A0A9P4H445_9PLEO|nr:ferredoxin reductase-like protein [Setomelanomma holmii]
MSELPIFTAADVSNHSTRNDLQVIIAGKVYDVTKYLRDHPGGADVLLEVAGNDATQAYADVGHSEDADEILKSFLIGTTTETKAPKKSREVKLVKQEPPVSAKGSLPSSYVNIGASSLALVGAAYCISLYGGAARRSLSELPGLKALSVEKRNFVTGFAVASFLSTVRAVYVAMQLKQFTKVDSGFMKYPSHRKQRQYVKKTSPHLLKGFLDPKEYKGLKITKITPLSGDVNRYTFALPDPKGVVGLPIGKHVAVKASIDDKPVSRSYTPISNNLDQGILELTIKIYPDGRLTGKYFAGLQVGDEVLFRGPKGAYTHTVGQCKKLGMIAGGTGITPMYQLIRAICEDEYDTAEISLIFANKTEEDIILRRELDTFARRYPKQFRVWYMLDHPPEKWIYGSGHIDQDLIKEKLPAPGPGNKVMLCGPPGLVNASKKALEGLGFKPPGAVAKTSDEIFCF